MLTSRSLLVLYGSQTGTAQEVAERIGRAATRRLFESRVLAMDEYDKMLLPDEPLVVFVASTTGDGDPPDNMSAFWKFLLRASLPKDVLSGMCFAVFGLGDSSYAKFNATSRKLNARLLQLGAVPLVDRGLGDEQSPLGIDGDLDAWLPLLWEAVLRRWPLPADHIINDAPVQQRPNFTVMLHPADELPVLAVRDAAEVLPADSPPPSCFSFTAPRGCYSLGFVATVVQNTRITSPDWKQDVRHIVFQVGDHAYAAGDIALIMPQNVGDGCELVNRLLARLRLKPMDVLSIGSTDDYRCWDASPAVVTAFDLFTKYLDVLSIPKRSLLEQLSFYAADAEQAEKLQEMASTAGTDVFHDYCRRERRCIVEVLEDFGSVTVPLNIFIELLPRIAARPYSIASSYDAKPGYLDVCVAVVQYETPFKRQKLGICSSWLAQLCVGDEALMWLKHGMISLPPSLETPLVLVGPGTGVAPLRSLLQQREFNIKQARIRGDDPAAGPVGLFFGCRHATKDYLFASEWEAMLSSSTLTVLRTAFSRDQAEKCYVQHKLAETARFVHDALTVKQGVLVIAGSAKRMPADVLAALQTIIEVASGISAEAAAAAVATLQRQKRIIIEAWS